MKDNHQEAGKAAIHTLRLCQMVRLHGISPAATDMPILEIATCQYRVFSWFHAEIEFCSQPQPRRLWREHAGCRILVWPLDQTVRDLQPGRCQPCSSRDLANRLSTLAVTIEVHTALLEDACCASVCLGVSRNPNALLARHHRDQPCHDILHHTINSCCVACHLSSQLSCCAAAVLSCTHPR